MLDRQADRFGDREALVHAEDGATLRWSYRELRAKADQVARGLIALGIGAG